MDPRRPARRPSIVQTAQKALLRALEDFDVSRLTSYTKPKIIHDPVWGTCEYEPWEASLLELPVFQRLRGLRQTGFAHLTYPAAEHSRFQHTLGVAAAASKVFDSVINGRTGLSPRARQARLRPALLRASGKRQRRWRCLVRLAALVHDLGHSLFSHTSERIYALIRPFPKLIKLLQGTGAKPPGAAEVVVYLLVTSRQWQSAVRTLWRGATTEVAPPTPGEWKRIGRWVMGQEDDPQLRFLADIISGPIDADKLDYVFRDGYVAGIPVGYDLARLTSTVCIDPQVDSKTAILWWRLTVPMKGINALEQLVMGRLVLNSYLYHHQKCRAAETGFERALSREYLGSKTVAGQRNVWDLFDLQDADARAFSKGASAAARRVRDVLQRRLRVRVIEFRYRDLQDRTEASSQEFDRLLELATARSWTHIEGLLHLEDSVARRAGLPRGSVVFDIPKQPDYADLENLLLPGRTPSEQESPTKVLNYRDWIAAYKVHRAWVRVFGPRGKDVEAAVWKAARVELSKRGLSLSKTARVHH